MKLTALLSALLTLVPFAQAEQESWGTPHTPSSTNNPEAKYANTPDLPFSGIAGFARLPHAKCLNQPGRGFDLAVLGMPFDVSFDPSQHLTARRL